MRAIVWKRKKKKALVFWWQLRLLIWASRFYQYELPTPILLLHISGSSGDRFVLVVISFCSMQNLSAPMSSTKPSWAPWLSVEGRTRLSRVWSVWCPALKSLHSLLPRASHIKVPPKVVPSSSLEMAFQARDSLFPPHLVSSLPSLTMNYFTSSLPQKKLLRYNLHI